MADSPSDPVARQVHRLFNFGALGTLSDAELLDRFASRADEAAEAAFEELVIRHGPMVLRVCRSVLGDVHDAEDAFQATFLVLANRARTIRRGASLASWLFGVAQRVASRVKRGNARQRALSQKVAERTPLSASPAEVEPDWEVVHAEIEGLPERLRAPLVLCYLEGQTSVAAASQLGLSEPTIRGRLARARERLRRRLIRRGLSTVPAPLHVAGTAARTQAAVPENLVQSTIRIALGFTSGNAAAALARGVLNAMRWNQLKVATVVVVLVAGSLCGVWLTLAPAKDDPGRNQAASKTAASPAKLAVPCRLTGTVKVEGTDEVVPGARVQILMGNDHPNERTVATGGDGRFVVDLKEGPVRVWLSDLPAGYLVASIREGVDHLTVGPGQAAIERAYRVRKGTIWSFRFTRGAEQKPSSGFVACNASVDAPLMSRSIADEHGQALLTLPAEGLKIKLSLSEAAPESAGLRTGSLTASMEWEANFRPDALREITRLPGNERRFRLVDADARSALIEVPESIEPVSEAGHLVIRVALPGTAPGDLATLTGKVVDAQGQPIAGALVAVTTPGAFAPSEPRRKAVTDDQGQYRLTDIPRQGIDGKAFPVNLLVIKEGYAGFGSPFLRLKESNPGAPQVVDAIRLERAVAISGIVVDHRGQPLAGVWVRSDQPFLSGGSSGTPHSAQTDAEGRFRIDGLRVGIAQVFVMYGTTHVSRIYLVDGSPVEARLALPDSSQEEAPPDLAALRAGPPPPIAVGQPAVEWQVGPWSDGRDHKLSDQGGTVVVLFFWGTTFHPSVSALPTLGKLAAEFQPRGVQFLTIHNAEPDEAHALEQGRRVLAFKGAPLPLAIDRTRIPKHARGLTAQEYGLRAPPLFVVIDRAGKIAFRSGAAAADPAQTAVFRQMDRDLQTMTEEKVNERIEKALRAEIEKVLNRQE